MQYKSTQYKNLRTNIIWTKHNPNSFHFKDKTGQTAFNKHSPNLISSCIQLHLDHLIGFHPAQLVLDNSGTVFACNGSAKPTKLIAAPNFPSCGDALVLPQEALI